jgi:DNA repair protein RecO (recombination protein O)
VAFTAYAGIGPSHTTLKKCYFDMITGQFTEQQPMHPDFFEPRDACLLNQLLKMTTGEIASLQLSGEERTELLAMILKYYTLHLTGIRQIRSLQVLKEIFR